MYLGRNTENKTFVFKSKIVKNMEESEILEIIIDTKLSFKYHAKNLCKKALQNVWALARLSKYVNDARKNLIFKSVIRFQFGYCPMV